MRHAAQLQTSDRLKKVLDVLQDRQWHSTLQIMWLTSLCAVGSAISELRANGLDIECRCEGKGRYEYRLVQSLEDIFEQGKLEFKEDNEN